MFLVFQNPSLDLSPEEDHGEISGEFGEVTIHQVIPIPKPEAPPLPPEEEEQPRSCTDNFKVIKGHHMKALLWKNFLWMSRNFG